MGAQQEWTGIVREISPGNPADAGTVARLHRRLLSWGPISKLGVTLLERFFYSRLVREGLVKAAVYEVNGRPAGFVAYTAYSITFHRQAIKKHWAVFSYYVFLSVIRNPLILPRLFKAFKLARSRRSEISQAKDPLGEILAIGVLPEFSAAPFIHKTGLRISLGLFDHAVDYFRGLRISKMRLAVDDFNKAAIYFYHSLGGRFERFSRAGDSMYQIWFDL
jgi:hypothetical protein